MIRRFDPSALQGRAGTLLFFAGWETLSRSGLVNAVMLPAPSTVVRSAWALLQMGELQSHLWASLVRALHGFAWGAGLGVLLGVAMARLPRFNGFTYPLVQMFRAIPAFAFVPLAVFWFGIGETSKVFLIAWGVFFPTWVNTFIGSARRWGRDFTYADRRLTARKSYFDNRE